MNKSIKNGITIITQFLKSVNKYFLKKNLKVIFNAFINNIINVILFSSIMYIIIIEKIYIEVFLVIQRYFIEISKNSFNFIINLVNFDTFLLESIIIILSIILIFSVSKYLHNLMKIDSKFKIWISITAFIFALFLTLIIILFESFYCNYRLVIFLLSIITGFYFLFIRMFIIKKTVTFLNENLIEANNILPMLESLKLNSSDFLLISKSLDQVYTSNFLENHYGLSGFNCFKNTRIFYFKNFSKNNFSDRYFYSINKKNDFLFLLKILKNLYFIKESNSVIFIEFIMFLNTKGYKHNSSHSLEHIFDFITEPENLHIIIPEILNNFKSHANIEFPLNSTKNREVNILEFLIQNFELFYTGLSIDNQPNNIILIKAFKDTLEDVLCGSFKIDNLFDLNIYSFNFLFVNCMLQLNEQDFSNFLIIFKSNLGATYHGEITPKTHLRNYIPNDPSFNDEEHSKKKLIIFFNQVSRSAFKFYKVDSKLIIFIKFFLMVVITVFLFSDNFYLFISGVQDDLNSLSVYNYFFVFFSLCFFSYRKKDILNSEIKLGIPNKIFVFQAVLLIFFIITVGLTSKPFLKIFLAIVKLIILFVLSLYAKKRNDNNIKLKILENFGQVFFDFHELSKTVPFLILLSKESVKPHFFDNYVFHFNIKIDHFEFGLYSPPLK